MTYRTTIYIQPTTLTDLTVNIIHNSEILNTQTLSDFTIYEDKLEGGISYINNTDTLKISSTGYKMQTIAISDIVNIESPAIILQPLEFSNIEKNSIKYYCKDETARTILNSKVNSTVENTTRGTTASIGYLNDYAPTMQLTRGNYQMICGCAEGAALSITDTTTNIQTVIAAIPTGIMIVQGQQQATLTLSSNNNLAVNGSEVVTKSEVWYDSSTSTLYIGVAQPNGGVL